MTPGAPQEHSGGLVTCKKCGTVIHLLKGNLFGHSCRFPDSRVPLSNRIFRIVEDTPS